MSWEPGLSRNRTLGAHPMGETQVVAGRLQGADEAGLRPSSPCHKGLLAPKLLARHNANHCSLAELEEAGSHQAG